VSDYFSLAARLFEVVVFSVSAGLAATMALFLRPNALWRRLFQASFSLLCVAVVVGTTERLLDDSPWTWRTLWLVGSGAFAVAALVAAVREG
jgi:hypothetical protein